MSRNSLVFIFLIMLFRTVIHASEISYGNCGSIQEVISLETQEIFATCLSDHDELAQLYVSRGESYLLNAQYDKAAEDFHTAAFHAGCCRDVDSAIIVAFRVAFGKVIAYDNLGMAEHTQDALEQLTTLASHIINNGCIEHLPCNEMVIPSSNQLHFRGLTETAVNTYVHDRIVICGNHKNIKGENQQPQQSGQQNYNDIVGPNQPPMANWCEEIVTGVGRAMDAITCLAPNYYVKVTLIGIIEALITRGLKCCQAGGFWKACVAPVSRKWREWNNNKEKQLLPNAKNLHIYVD